MVMETSLALLYARLIVDALAHLSAWRMLRECGICDETILVRTEKGLLSGSRGARIRYRLNLILRILAALMGSSQAIMGAPTSTNEKPRLHAKKDT